MLARPSRFSFVLTAVFLAVSGWLAWHHELWRDEMQAWLIARDSSDWSTLAGAGHYEGTPPLWHFLLRLLTFITHRPAAMQVFQWLLAGLTFFVLCRFSPFSRAQKTLLLGNYYFLFEYGTVTRQYLLGTLCLCLACLCFPRETKNPWPFVLALAGAAFTSTYALIVASALGFAWWTTLLIPIGKSASQTETPSVPASPAPADPATAPSAQSAARPPRSALTRSWGPAAFFILALAVAVGSMLPAPDTFYAPADGWHFHWDAERTARVAVAFTSSQLPLPRPPGYLWIPPWLTDFSWGQDLAALGAVPLFLLSVFLLRRSRPAVVFYLVASVGLCLFLQVKYLGYVRHAGFLFITFLLACWLAAPTFRPDSRARIGAAPGGWLLTLLLLVQAVTGVWAAQLDGRRLFSCGEEAARAIADRHLEKAFIAAWPDASGSVIAGYLDRSVYLPQSARLGSFVHWDRSRNEQMTDAEALQATRTAGKGAPTLVVLDHELDDEVIRRWGMIVLGPFRGSLVPFEDYFVYFLPGANGVP